MKKSLYCPQDMLIILKKYETIEKLLALKTRIRFNDFKAIEAAIIKNKAFNEFGELSNLAEKQYPKACLPIMNWL